MSTYSRYSGDDLTKAFDALEQGHTTAWVARRYGVPKSTLSRKYREFKKEKDDEKADS